MPGKILIVEDDPLVAMMLEDFLEALGRVSAGVVDRVAAALAAIEQGDMGCAIVDVHLGNGETAEPVADALTARNIPFVVATGGFIAPPSPALAGRPTLLKPFNFETLSHALAQL